ncbi:MAG: UDP-N-acetylglucosamine--N-acetylmuramyl-(pentapeptide) pyrophosphoryl-undecaprenol N-acetylglucosamine transferase, partial [bacterium]|nr:UDP-N-acetylglucosamine--N-acetylmuramyl-(pentapeptide) pyrophosphoryl-undecaprenol N-acetylglucosamine transferase [bacterium]
IIRIAFTGGGSGGHVYPLIAVAEALREEAKKVPGVVIDLHYFGPLDDYARTIAEQNISIHPILSSKYRRYFSIENVFDVPKFFIGIFQSFFKLYGLMPDVIFSKGGPGALPVVIVGWFYRIPIIIHESDAIPGLTNSLSARFARRIAVSFPNTLEYFHPSRVVLTGNPIRSVFTHGAPEQGAAKNILGFDSTKPLLLVLGGSQGSAHINEFIVLNVINLIAFTQVLHQTGPTNFLETKKLADASLLDLTVKEELKSRYEAVGFLDAEKLRTALSASDVVVARAGSGALAEIAAAGKPSVLIPLEGAANDHQKVNAYEFAKTGAAVVIEEENLATYIFTTTLKSILDNPEVKKKMHLASAVFGNPDAAILVANEILELA